MAGMGQFLLNIMFAAQNCNSLNVSSINRTMATKLTTITNLNADITFLSDIRLNNKHKKVSVALRNDFRFFYNSTLSRRGVGIIVRNNVNMIVHGQYADASENILLLNCTINDVHVILGSIYGPNTNHESFFEDLTAGINSLPRVPVILGGDWNTTNSAAPARDNLDVIFMQDIPSLARTQKLSDFKINFELADPFRLRNPLLRDYSYVPHGNLRRNRSRIDFFLVSACLLCR